MVGADLERGAFSEGPSLPFENKAITVIDMAAVRETIRSEMRKCGLPDMTHSLRVKGGLSEEADESQDYKYKFYRMLQYFT